MAEFTVKFEGADKVIADLGQVPSKTRKAVGDMVKRLQYDLVNAARAFYDQVLKSRTGGLKGSIQPGEYVETNTQISGSVVAGGGPEMYARIHEYGGTINAKNVQNLTIPLDAAMTPMGVGRFSARQVISDPSQFGFTGTFFRHGVLFGQLGIEKKRAAKGATIGGVVPLFVLKPSVTLPERSFMRPALAQIAARLPGEAQKAIDEATKG